MSRKKARENRRIKAWNAKHGIREERLDLRDTFGMPGKRSSTGR